MSSSIFTTASNAINVSHVIAVGKVMEIPEEKKKGEATHSFSIITSIGNNYSYYRSVDSAKSAKSALIAMMRGHHTNVFKSAQHVVSCHSVVAFTKVFPLKEDNEFKAAFKVIIATTDEKKRELWFRYSSEDNANKGRKALYAAVQYSNNSLPDEDMVVRDESVDEGNQ